MMMITDDDDDDDDDAADDDLERADRVATQHPVFPPQTLSQLYRGQGGARRGIGVCAAKETTVAGSAGGDDGG